MYKLVDVFLFEDNTEMLKLCIDYLYPKIDRFLIIDRPNGDCAKILSKLNIPTDKIKVVEIDNTQEIFAKEKNNLRLDIAKFFIEPDEIAIVHQQGQIINKGILDYFVEFAQDNPYNIVRFPLVKLSTSINKKIVPDLDLSSFICMGCHLQKYTLSEIKQNENKLFPNVIPNLPSETSEAGWSFFNDDEGHQIVDYSISALPNQIKEHFFKKETFLKMCFNYLEEESTIVELGSSTGEGSCFLAQLIKESNKKHSLYCIDDPILDEFLDNIQEKEVDQFIRTIKFDTSGAAQLFNDESINFIFFNSSDKDSENFLSWLPKLDQNALLAGNKLDQVKKFMFDSKLFIYENFWLLKK